MSLAILKHAIAVVVIAPWLITIASCAASASNLLGAVRNGSFVIAAMRSATLTSKPLGLASPVPTAVPPCASSISIGIVISMRATPFSTCFA